MRHALYNVLDTPINSSFVLYRVATTFISVFLREMLTVGETFLSHSYVGARGPYSKIVLKYKVVQKYSIFQRYIFTCFP